MGLIVFDFCRRNLTWLDGSSVEFTAFAPGRIKYPNMKYFMTTKKGMCSLINAFLLISTGSVMYWLPGYDYTQFLYICRTFSPSGLKHVPRRETDSKSTSTKLFYFLKNNIMQCRVWSKTHFFSNYFIRLHFHDRQFAFVLFAPISWHSVHLNGLLSWLRNRPWSCHKCVCRFIRLGGG